MNVYPIVKEGVEIAMERQIYDARTTAQKLANVFNCEIIMKGGREYGDETYKPTIIGYWPHLIGYPDLMGKKEFFEVRELPDEIKGKTPYEKERALIQIKVVVFGELVWINVPRNEIVMGA